MPQHDVDVLIAGAGPVGLTAALQLARWGVSARLIDTKPVPATTSRALNTHARTIEMYDQMGVLGDIAPFGVRVNAFVRHLQDGPVRLEYNYDGLITRFPYMFFVDQAITERVLRGHAAAEGVPVEWSTTLRSFTQDSGGVDAVLEHADRRTETVRARYLWGCDGGHSIVRKSLGLPLQGESTYTWLIADAVLETPLARDAVHWIFPPGGGMVMLFPFPDAHKWRLLDTTGEGDPTDLDQISAMLSAKLTQGLGQTTPVHTATWASAFTIQQRAVPAMHVNRVFVSGDAAHVHSPASGQGMNTSMQDAFNLAWKLAMVFRGHADADLLKTYDTERVPVGQALLTTTKEVMENAMFPDTDETRESDYAFLRQLVRGMSGLALEYPDSPLTIPGPSGSGPRPGQRLTQINASDADSPGWTRLRAELRNPAWHLLIFAPAEIASAPNWLEMHVITGERSASQSTIYDPDGRLRSTLAAKAADWILVRPDGYVSARGSNFTYETTAQIITSVPYLLSGQSHTGAAVKV